MILAEVVGTVVTNRLANWIQGDASALPDPSLLLIQEVGAAGARAGQPFVALDLVGARQGERVLVSQGSSVRQTDGTKDRPVDAIIAGIVDLVEKNGDYVYKKDTL